ncbi:sensor histidine kinase [Roseivirga pacifica]|uniref:sensor histidine kinase n=1 Tax=Roseivirga pacifica TaxID=1267423 RepID=UPI0020941601|nr:histidine kinase [Roseivirga pacifica]MCO6358644.1 hypothetical protein [Roseivirga pacifica]MCO6365720.1 hypothetical protein [Roseivirga pacifica]MCO6371550.1 hypothetical protein [Roseivirga pacifica]MCO6376339.1 hypothetical protein [Roseivirga pacifica]MCO6378928.1 hypothetical protein [Roseivirga pacifica]
MNKNITYWACQIGGWTIHTMFLIAMIGMFGGTNALNQGIIILQFIILIGLIISSHIYRLYVKQHQWHELAVKQLIPRALLGAFITSVIAQVFIHLIIYWLTPLNGIQPFSIVSFWGYVFNVFLVMCLWSTIYFSVKSARKTRAMEVEKLALKAALQEAELMVLKNQINPHFLFNALNNIRSLILIEPEKARKMITHISDLLRYSIQFNASEKVALKEEVEIVKDYLQLESIQFEDRLKYELDISPETLEIPIPPMAVQLLVENAIKHGLSIQKDGGNIIIKTSKDTTNLTIEVVNSGQLQPKQKREGIGLNNLMERLKILFGPFAVFSLTNTENNTVTASLKIPLK